jgi:Flp pilus assembly protein TadG
MAKCLQKEISGRVRAPLMQRLKSEEVASEIVEFAFVSVIVLLLLIGIIYIGRAVSVYQALQRAAREGARVALAPTCASCGDNINDPTAAINSALSAASLNPMLANITILNPSNQPLDPSDPANYQGYEVQISISYPMRMFIPTTIWTTGMNSTSTTPFVITSTVTMRQEY